MHDGIILQEGESEVTAEFFKTQQGLQPGCRIADPCPGRHGAPHEHQPAVRSKPFSRQNESCPESFHYFSHQPFLHILS